MPTRTGIVVSPALIKRLPKSEQGSPEKIGGILWKKSGGKCHLCNGELNKVSDRIVPDHEIPEREKGGDDKLANLNLTHASCNAFKRNNPTAPVSAYLTFQRFLRELNGPALYVDCLPHFKVNPVPVVYEEKGSVVTFHLPSGKKETVPVYSEKNAADVFRYCFVQVPVNAISHDTDCQPRTIKERQVWSIFNDLQHNPLHEPPSCRTAKIASGKVSLLMFDGQHKTIATILMQRSEIAVKVYFNLSPERTRHLVNSIQAKIPKLPLSALELMTKMGREYEDRLATYAEEKETDGSEAGFIEWVGGKERARAKQAFQNAVLAAVWEGEDLDLREHVAQSTQHSKEKIPEAALKDKLLKPLLYLAPLSTPFEEGEVVRERERELVTKVLNSWVEYALTPSGEPPTEKERQAVHRRRYQSAMGYVSQLLRKGVAHILRLEEGECLGKQEVKPKHITEIKGLVKRVATHPVWTHAYTTGPMKAVEEALLKNQNADKAFKKVGLNIGYALTGELDRDWAE